MENRCLLSVSGPVFQTPLANAYWIDNTTAGTQGTLTIGSRLLDVLPTANVSAGGLSFAGAGWLGNTLTMSAPGVTVTGSDVAVGIVGGTSATTLKNVVDELNNSASFQALHITASLSGADGPATALSQTTLTPGTTGLSFTAPLATNPITFTIKDSGGDPASVAVNGNDVTISILSGTTTWQQVVNLVNGSAAMQTLEVTATLAGVGMLTPSGGELATAHGTVTLDPSVSHAVQMLPNSSAGGLQFSPATGWTGSTFSLELDPTDLTVTVAGNDLSVIFVPGQTTVSDVIDALNSDPNFAALNVTVTPTTSGTDKVTAVAETMLTPATTGLRLYETAAGSFPSITIVWTTDADPSVVVSGTDITVNAVEGATTWQAVADLLNNSADVQNLHVSAALQATTAAPVVPAELVVSHLKISVPAGAIVLTGAANAASNNITATIVDGTALNVSVSGQNITITLNTGTSTLQDVVDALNGNTDVTKTLGVRAVVSGSDAVAGPAAKANLSGGTDRTAAWTRSIGIDGYEKGNVPLTISAVSDNPDLVVSAPGGGTVVDGVLVPAAGTKFAKIHYVDKTTGKSMGDIVLELYSGTNYAYNASAQRFINLATYGTIQQQALGSSLAASIIGTAEPVVVAGLTFSAVAGTSPDPFTLTIINGTPSSDVPLPVDVVGQDVTVTIAAGTSTWLDVQLALSQSAAFGALNVTSSLADPDHLGALATVLDTKTVTIPAADSFGLSLTSQKTGLVSLKIVAAPAVPDGAPPAVPSVSVNGKDITATIVVGTTTLSELRDLLNGNAAVQALAVNVSLLTGTDGKAFVHDKVTLAGLTFGANGATGNGITVKIVSGTAYGLSASGNNLTVTIPPGKKWSDVSSVLLYYTQVTQDPAVWAIMANGVNATLVGTDGPALATSQVALSGGYGNLTNSTPFYSNAPVHRVIPGFMVQSGDGQFGNGTGGSGLPNLTDAFDPTLTFGGEGQLAMANSGPNSSNAQFFITEYDPTYSVLFGSAPTGYTPFPYTSGDGTYMIFGQMISGQSTLEALANLPRDTTQNSPTENRPYDNVVMQSVTIFDSPQDGTLLLTALDGFTTSAHVTITLTDPSGKTKTQTILVVPKCRTDETNASGQYDKSNFPALPDPTDPAYQTVTSGQAITTVHTAPTAAIFAPYSFTYTVNSTDKLLKPTVSATGDLNLAVPSTYVGTATMYVSAAYNTYTAGGITTNIKNGFAETPTTVTQTSTRVLANSGIGSSWVPTAAGDTVWAMQVVTDTTANTSMLYEALGSGGLKIYDITDPANPVLKGSSAGDYVDVKVATQTIGTTSSTVAYLTSASGPVTILNVTDPVNIPAALGTLTSGSNSQRTVLADIGSEKYAIVLGGTRVDVFNVTDPSNPSADVPVTFGSTKGIKFHNAVNAGVAQTAEGAEVLYVEDSGDGAILEFLFNDPTTPIFINWFGTAGQPVGMDFQGSTMFIADMKKGLLAVDVSNPLKPKLMGQYHTSAPALGVMVQNETAFVATQGAIVGVLIHNLKKMTAELTFSADVTAMPALFTSGDLVKELLVPASGGYATVDVAHLLNRLVATPGAPAYFTDGQSTPNYGRVMCTNARVNIYMSNVNGSNIQTIEVIPTGANATVAVDVAYGGFTPVAEIVIDGNKPVAKFAAAAVDLTGEFLAENTYVKALTLGNISEGATVTLTGGSGVNFTAYDVNEIAIAAGTTAFNTLLVHSWTDTVQGNNDIAAKSITSIQSTGDFDADLNLLGTGKATTKILGSVKVGGFVQNVQWDVAGAMGDLTATNGVKNSRIATDGNMGTLSLGLTDTTDFLAGITLSDSTERHATNAGEFTNPAASIKGINITNFMVHPTQTGLMVSGSIVAATVQQGSNATTLQGLADMLNANTNFQNLHITASLAGDDGPATSLTQTTITPGDTGLEMTATGATDPIDFTIVAASGSNPAGVTVSGTSVTISIVLGTTTWQNVADLMNANADVQALGVTTDVVGFGAKPGNPDELATIHGIVTLDPATGSSVKLLPNAEAAGLHFSPSAGWTGSTFSFSVVAYTQPFLLVDSNFSAATIGTSTLRNINTTTAPANFGLYVLTNSKNTQANSVTIWQDSSVIKNYSSKTEGNYTLGKFEIESLSL